MSVVPLIADDPTPHAPAPPRGPFLRRLFRAEDVLLMLVLVGMVLLPVAEIILRTGFHTGISNTGAIVQHLTLVVGMLGAAIAAREGKLLALAPVQALLKGTARDYSLIFSSAFSATVSFFLVVASWNYVAAVKPLGKVLAYGIPVWVIQIVLPAGFILLTARVFWRTVPRWSARGLTIGLALLFIALVWWSPGGPEKWLWPAMIVLVVATILGAPIYCALGGAALILFWSHELPVEAVPLKHYSLTTNDTLPCIPLFTLAGYFLAESGASQRLVRVFQALVGQLRGGPAIMTALVCAFFTSFTGASGVTILALGGVLLPVLLAAKYSERSALGLLTGAGSLGMLFPPCLPLILYVVVANHSARADLSIKEMFLGGLGPGILLVIITAWWGIRQGPKNAERPHFQISEAWSALWAAKWEMLIPVVAIGALFVLPTTVEAAAITAAYALLISTVIHRDLPLRRLPDVMRDCGLLVGGVLLILGLALGFTHYLVDAQVPETLVDWATTTIKSKWLFLLALNLVLLVVGGVIEIYAAIVVVVPLLVPIGVAFGIDPIHLGIIFLANMELGFLFPPVGLNLLLSSSRFNRPMPEVIRATFPMLVVLFIGVLLITYIPQVTTFIPSLFK